MGEGIGFKSSPDVFETVRAGLKSGCDNKNKKVTLRAKSRLPSNPFIVRRRLCVAEERLEGREHRTVTS